MLRELIFTKAIEQARQDGFVGEIDEKGSCLAIVNESCQQTVERTSGLCSKERWQQLNKLAEDVAGVALEGAKADEVSTKAQLLLYLLDVDMEVIAHQFDQQKKLIHESIRMWEQSYINHGLSRTGNMTRASADMH